MAEPTAHYQLTEEDAHIGYLMTASASLPKCDTNMSDDTWSETDDGRDDMSKVLRKYIEKGFDVNRTFFGQSLLHFVVQFDLNAEIIALLVEKGASLSQTDCNGSFPLTVALKNFPRTRHTLLALLEANADMQPDDTGGYWLQYLVRSADRDTDAGVMQALLEKPQLFEGCSQDEVKNIVFSAVSTAISRQAPVKFVRPLLDFGAYVESGNNPFGRLSLLGRAISLQLPDVIASVLDGGLNTEAAHNGITLLFYTIKCAKIKCGVDIQFDEMTSNPFVQILDRLLSHGAKPNVLIDSIRDEIYQFWNSEEAKELSIPTPSKYISGFVALYDMSDYRDGGTNLTSFADDHYRYINIYYAIYLIEKLVDAGALPLRGSIPKDVVESLVVNFNKSCADPDNKSLLMLRLAITLILDKLEATGFDLHFPDTEYFVMRPELQRDEDYILPEAVAEILDGFERNHRNPHSLQTLAVIQIRETLVTTAECTHIQNKIDRLPHPLLIKLVGLREIPSALQQFSNQ